MPQNYKKLCLECLREFENPGSKGCPYCSSDRWNFINDSGRIIKPYLDVIKQRRRGYRRAYDGRR